jgi:hypothetical protein
MPVVTTHRVFVRHLFLLAAVTLSGCIPRVPFYDSTTRRTGHEFCSDFLRYAHACVSSATFIYLFCVCTAVVLGFLAAQLNNDPTGSTTFAKHRSTFLFVVAAVAGILGAYFHSRADAASVAAADIENALATRRDFRKYQLCLGAASKWDGSRSEALDAAYAIASDKSSNESAPLSKAMDGFDGSQAKTLEAIDKSNRAAQGLFQFVERTQSPQRRQTQLQPQVTLVQDALKEAQQALEQAKVHAESTRGMVAQFKSSLVASDDPDSAKVPPPAPPTRVVPVDGGPLSGR